MLDKRNRALRLKESESLMLNKYMNVYVCVSMYVGAFKSE